MARPRARRPHTTTTTSSMSTSSMRASRAMPRAVFARTVRGTTRFAIRETTRVDKAGPVGRGRSVDG